MNSRLISSPTTRKNTVSSASLTQCSSDSRNSSAADDDPGLVLPEARSKPGPSGELVSDDREHGREQQQQAGRGRPAGEVERRDPDPVPERAEHRVAERALVPGAVVAPAVDEEGRRDQHAARPGAALVLGDPRPRSRLGAPSSAARPRSAATTARSSSVSVGERVISVTCARQKLVGVRRPLDQHRGAPGDVAAGQRLVAEDVGEPVAERVARLGDVLVGGAAVGAGVAAVLDQLDPGVRPPEDVVPARIDRTVQPVRRRCPCTRPPALPGPTLEPIPPPKGTAVVREAFG